LYSINKHTPDIATDFDNSQNFPSPEGTDIASGNQDTFFPLSPLVGLCAQPAARRDRQAQHHLHFSPKIRIFDYSLA
jgi:hypothetical protein